MRLSRDKVMHLSHLIVNALDDSENLTWLTDKNSARMEIANVLLKELQSDNFSG